MESTDVGEGGRGERGPGGVVEGEKHLRMVYYYYINYKQFVNVVKYKLDKMRKAIEAEEKKVCVGGREGVRRKVCVCVREKRKGVRLV